MHRIAKVDRDADAHVKRHRKDLDAGPGRVAAVVWVQRVFTSGDSSSRRPILLVAPGNERELQSQDIAALITAVYTGPFAAGMISPRDAGEAEVVDREGGDVDEADVAHDRDDSWVEGDVQEPVEAAVQSLVWHVVEEG